MKTRILNSAVAFFILVTPTVVFALSATTDVATNITHTNAMLRGVIGRDALGTCYGRFEWGLTTNYGNLTTNVSVGSGSGSVAISNTLSSLAPNTPYHYRAVGSNSFLVPL